jgi:hypothetical protein
MTKPNPTLATLDQYSAQEVFDFVVRFLRKQGKPATTYSACRYRTSDGLACAVGCLIPNDEIACYLDARLFGESTLLKEWGPQSKAFTGWKGEHRDLLIFLQDAHDRGSQEASDWLYRFLKNARQVAHRLSLSPEVCDEPA